MHQGQLPHLQHQIMLTKKRRLPKLLRKETHLHMPKQRLQRH